MSKEENPERIYLQTEENANSGEGGRTWCVHKMFDDCTKYIRADLCVASDGDQNEEVKAAYELGREEGYNTCQAERDASDESDFEKGYERGYDKGYAAAPRQLAMFEKEKNDA